MRYVLFLLLILSACGCARQVYVPVPTVSTDTVYTHEKRVDSVFVRDSVFVEKGDTVREFRYKSIYVYRDRHDTICISKADSVGVPYPVERELSKWERTKVDYGGWALLGVFFVLLFVFGKSVYMLRK